jgi:hypothetical protein
MASQSNLPAAHTPGSRGTTKIREDKDEEQETLLWLKIVSFRKVGIREESVKSKYHTRGNNESQLSETFL